jgi:ubiquinone/menaquinone biosynthesis C-methylase UbiE
MARLHPIFSAIYDFIMAPQEYFVLGRQREAVLAGLTGCVLEVGAGTGLNFPKHSRDAVVFAIEPDDSMLERAKARRDAAAARVILIAADAEALPFRAASFDAVVSTLVFCTIPNPPAALRELRRVLKVGGAFRFLEHVRSSTAIGGSMQDAIAPVWKRLFGGCHPNRDTISAFRAAGFAPAKLSGGIMVRGEATAA